MDLQRSCDQARASTAEPDYQASDAAYHGTENGTEGNRWSIGNAAFGRGPALHFDRRGSRANGGAGQRANKGAA